MLDTLLIGNVCFVAGMLVGRFLLSWLNEETLVPAKVKVSRRSKRRFVADRLRESRGKK